MRIDAYNAVSQVYKTSAYAREKGMAVKKTEKDKYELSDTARLYNTAKAAVSEASDVRLDKVNDIKARIAARGSSREDAWQCIYIDILMKKNAYGQRMHWDCALLYSFIVC